MTAIACGFGLLTLLLTAYASGALPHREMLMSYFENPLLVALNCLPAVLFAWLFCFLFGRFYAGVLGSGVLCVGFALVNYYKLALRGDPFLPSDFVLLRTAGGIMSRYQFELTNAVKFSLAALLAATVFALLLLRGKLKARVRIIGGIVCLLAIFGVYRYVYMNNAVYVRTANDAGINPWSETEVSISRGFTLSFIRAIDDALPRPPKGYTARSAQKLLADYDDADIPAERRVSVIGVMLEAFCDLTDYPVLAESKRVQEVYAPLHEIEKNAVSGRLITNIFAGGTVESEWEFLTGASRFDTFRTDTDSYVRYFTAQGYTAHYTHPGYQWFYDRENVNRYLGFEENLFTETGFDQFVDPVVAAWHSDKQLTDYLYDDFTRRSSDNFSFAVSYQNHGPYDSTPAAKTYLTTASGLSEESCNIINNYLYGVEDTVQCYAKLLQKLEERSEPVVVVLFGDHKPWLGNNNSVYTDMGISFDLGTVEGLKNYYATPYIIWANSAARKTLGADFSGSGGDFSPCFLMTRLFDECGWTGPGFMQLSREMRAISPVLSVTGQFLQDGTLTDTLDPDGQVFYSSYLAAQYYREKEYGR